MLDDDEDFINMLLREEDKKMSEFDSLGSYIGGNYIKLKNEEPLIAVYKGFEVQDNPFGKEKGDKRVVYFFEVDGEEKVLTSTSKRLAVKMMNLQPKKGTKLSIERIGTGFDTDFEVKLVA